MKSDKEILEAHGWEIECESPFEIKHSDGSFASGQAANYVLDAIRSEKKYEHLHLAKEAYQADMINEEVFIKNVITALEW